MRLVEARPNIELREGEDGALFVVLAFPYEAGLVDACRRLPGRTFDWDTREWKAPADDWVGLAVLDILDRFPELTTDVHVEKWLAGLERRWVGYIRTTRHDGRGWWTLETLAGVVPDALLEGAVEHGGQLLVPFTMPAAECIADLRSARVSTGAVRCVTAVELGEQPPPAQVILARGVDGERFELETLWDASITAAFERIPGVNALQLPLDPWIADDLASFISLHGVKVTPSAARALDALLDERRAAAGAIRRSRADHGEPIPEVAALLGGELAPFQWAGVRYVLDARRTFLADEQGLGKTVQALAALEADGAFPAIVICPASMKLTWERETVKWLPHRSVSVLNGRAAVPPRADLTILNYELVADHRLELGRRKPRALIVDESHYCKNPHAKRTQAVRRLADSVHGDGLRVALTGTPVLNHAEELIAQLRVIGRITDFGSGAQFAREFKGQLNEERLHWHLRRRCFARRLKSEVLPQLPAKRRVVVPVSLTNESDYRLAERDVIAWLRTQPLDLTILNAKIAATLRAERLAQLTALQRLAARGKLAAALAWIDDFLASGEALVVFARHKEVQQAVLRKHKDALHLLGDDSIERREASIAAFQKPDGPQLIVCATRVAAQGITLTRASNVCFLELEWTPAMHDQAEDRCHRIGQDDAVTAWYLLAAATIDETMTRLIAAKREHVAAVTDGKPSEVDSVLEGVVRELREGRPFRHLRAIA